MRAHLAVFARGFTIVSLVAANTAQIAGHHVIGAFIVGAGISWCWFGNARVAGRTELRFAREAYALGAATGTVVGMVTVRWWYGG